MIKFAQFIIKMKKHCYDSVFEQFRNTDLGPDEKKDLTTTATLTIHWTGLSRLQFQKALAGRKVSIHYTIQDFKTDLDTLESMPH